ncbi:Ig alpha-1 chain C region, partial [Galemys pyrenaicus]
GGPGDRAHGSLHYISSVQAGRGEAAQAASCPASRPQARAGDPTKPPGPHLAPAWPAHSTLAGTPRPMTPAGASTAAGPHAPVRPPQGRFPATSTPQPDHRPDMMWQRPCQQGRKWASDPQGADAAGPSREPQTGPDSGCEAQAQAPPGLTPPGHRQGLQCGRLARPGPTQGTCRQPEQCVCVAASKTSPTVFPLRLESKEEAEPVVIGCLVRGFIPMPATVTWIHGGMQGVTIRDYVPTEPGSGGLYTMSSQLQVPAGQCPASSSVQCRVQHYSSSKTLDVPCRGQRWPDPREPAEQSRGRREGKEGRNWGWGVPTGPSSAPGKRRFATPCPTCPPPTCQPRLALREPALDALLLGSEANLTCTLSGLSDPQGAQLTWSSSCGKTAVQGTPERDPYGCYTVSSTLLGCTDPWNKGETFTCTASSPKLTQPLKDSVSKSSGLHLKPQVHLLPPPSEELALNELVTLTCLVRGFSPEQVLVRWQHGDQEVPLKDYLTWGPLRE